MNRMNGSTEETLEVMGDDTKRLILNLAEIVDHKGQPSVRRRGDWVPVARQRRTSSSSAPTRPARQLRVGDCDR